MKKLIAITLALLLCVGMLFVGVSAADDYWCIAGTMNDWNANGGERMTDNGDGTYTYTFANMAAGSYDFKFTKNGSWDYNLGGAFMGSGVESSLYQNGSNITFTLEAANDVTIVLDAANNKFTLTIGGQIAEEPENITIHVSVPEDWGSVYGYVWNPESLGSWPGTLATDGTFVLPAVFDGFIVNNNSGRQTADIKDIDLTKSEVWVTVHADNTYSLSYEAPNQDTPVIPEPMEPIFVHVIAPASWENVYAYTFNPEQTGTWPGTLVEGGIIGVTPNFEGLIINNGAGSQTGDIKDIDLTKSDVWVVVADDCSYALFYNEADVVIPTPTPDIKINIVAEHWTNVYAYTYNPANCGNWPGTLVETGSIVVPASFEGLVLNNGEGQQTADITDIDLTKEEVWIIVNEDNSYTLSYEAPVVDDPGQEPVGPETGDAILPGVLVLLLSVTGLVMLSGKKEN